MHWLLQKTQIQRLALLAVLCAVFLAGAHCGVLAERKRAFNNWWKCYEGQAWEMCQIKGEWLEP